MHDAESQATAIRNIKAHQLSYKPTQIVGEYDYGTANKAHKLSYCLARGEGTDRWRGHLKNL